MARTSKKDWLEEGFRILSVFAQDKLRMQYLCERLGMTRGSFYHHFNGMDDYIDCLMKEWEERNTITPIKVSDTGDDPIEQMMLLTETVSHANHSVEAAIRSWSCYNPIVKEHLQRVDDKRLAYLRKLFRAMGRSTALARKLAQLEYATLIGLQQLKPNMTAREMRALYEVYLTER